MPFDLQTWKDEFKKSLPGWKKRLGKSGLNNAYFLIAASSFLPVIQAVHINNDWGSLALLGSAVGGNLLANMVQKLKDKSETEVAEALAKEVQAEPVLQVELDALLKELDALKEAEHALAAEDKEWFVETIQKELKQLNSGVTNTATLIGDGAIAQGDGAIGLGKNAKYYAGDHVENKYEAPGPHQAEKERGQEAQRKYLQKLRRACQYLPLAAMGGEEGLDDEITLERVYIDLDTRQKILTSDLKKIRSGKKVDLKTLQTTERNLSEHQISGFEKDDKEVVSLPLLEAARLTPRCVVLGDPGAGKSTFVRSLLAIQASVLLGERQPMAGFDPQLIPLYVVLRDLATRLIDLDLERQSAVRQRQKLAEALRAHLLAELSNFGAQDFAGSLGEALDANCILLVLDGLDEVPARVRLLVRRMVNALIADYNPARLIVTSRIRSYSGEAVMPFPSFTIAPFDREKISAFALGWYDAQIALGRVVKEKATERLRTWRGRPWR